MASNGSRVCCWGSYCIAPPRNVKNESSRNGICHNLVSFFFHPVYNTRVCASLFFKTFTYWLTQNTQHTTTIGNREKERVLFFVGFCYNKFTFSCSRYFSHSYIFFISFEASSPLLLFAVAFDLFLLLLLLLLSSSSLLLSKLFTRFIYFETLSIHYNESLHNAHTHFSLSLSLSLPHTYTYAHK